MTIEQAFAEGLRLVRAAGIEAKGNDVAVLAAYAVFERAAKRVMTDPRFPLEGPPYARRLLVRALYSAAKQQGCVVGGDVPDLQEN